MADIKNVQEPSSLKNLIQGMAPETLNVLTGRVISISPLEIQIIGDDKLILTENIICLPRHLTDYSIEIDIMLDNGGLDSKTQAGDMLATLNITKATATVHNSLEKDDIVYILSFNEGKKYYILDREEEK